MTENYVIHSADAIHRDITILPEVGGLYAFMLKDAGALDQALKRAGLVMDVMGVGQKPLLYIGASGADLRNRVQCHLRNDTQTSTFRMSLGALLADELNLQVKPVGYRNVFGFIEQDEARLTAWMRAHLDVGVLPAIRPMEVERRAIRTQDPMLNITGRRAHDLAWTILLLRRACVEKTLGDQSGADGAQAEPLLDPFHGAADTRSREPGFSWGRFA